MGECEDSGGEVIDGLCVTKEDAGARSVARGERFERKILGRLKRSNCVVSMRSAGSYGTWDLICIAPDKIRVIQAKTNGYLSPSERAEMLDELQRMPDNVQGEIEYYISPRNSTTKLIKKDGETDWGRVKKRLDYFATQRGYSETLPKYGLQYLSP